MYVAAFWGIQGQQWLTAATAVHKMTSHDDVIKWKHFPRYWICVGNSPVTSEFPTQMPVTRSFNVFFDLRQNKRLSKQSWGWWFETPSRPLWRHCNVRGKPISTSYTIHTLVTLFTLCTNISRNRYPMTDVFAINQVLNATVLIFYQGGSFIIIAQDRWQIVDIYMNEVWKLRMPILYYWNEKL